MDPRYYLPTTGSLLTQNIESKTRSKRIKILASKKITRIEVNTPSTNHI